MKMNDFVSQKKKDLIATVNTLYTYLFINSLFMNCAVYMRNTDFLVMEEVCVIFKELISNQNVRVSMLILQDAIEI